MATTGPPRTPTRAFAGAPLPIRSRATSLVAGAFDLVLLDRLWTDYLGQRAGGDPLPTDDVAELQQLTGKMAGLLGTVGALGAQLLPEIAELHDQLDDAFDDALVDHEMSYDCLASARDGVAALGGMSAIAQEAFEALAATASSEARILAAKLDRVVTDRSVPEGDLSPRFLKYACFAGAGASLLLFAGADGASIAIALVSLGLQFDQSSGSPDVA